MRPRNRETPDQAPVCRSAPQMPAKPGPQRQPGLPCGWQEPNVLATTAGSQRPDVGGSWHQQLKSEVEYRGSNEGHDVIFLGSVCCSLGTCWYLKATSSPAFVWRNPGLQASNILFLLLLLLLLLVLSFWTRGEGSLESPLQCFFNSGIFLGEPN